MRTPTCAREVFVVGRTAYANAPTFIAAFLAQCEIGNNGAVARWSPSSSNGAVVQEVTDNFRSRYWDFEQSSAICPPLLEAGILTQARLVDRACARAVG